MGVTERKHDDSAKAGVILFMIGSAIVIGMIFMHATSGGNNNASSPPPPKPKATFTSSMTLGEPLNPATAVAEVLVQNTSDVAGSPECYIQMSDVSGVYHGSDIFSFDKVLQPGEKWGFHGRITVTKEGAAYVTKGSVSCT